MVNAFQIIPLYVFILLMQDTRKSIPNQLPCPSTRRARGGGVQGPHSAMDWLLIGLVLLQLAYYLVGRVGWHWVHGCVNEKNNLVSMVTMLLASLAVLYILNSKKLMWWILERPDLGWHWHHRLRHAYPKVKNSYQRLLYTYNRSFGFLLPERTVSFVATLWPQLVLWVTLWPQKKHKTLILVHDFSNRANLRARRRNPWCSNRKTWPRGNTEISRISLATANPFFSSAFHSSGTCVRYRHPPSYTRTLSTTAVSVDSIRFNSIHVFFCFLDFWLWPSFVPSPFTYLWQKTILYFLQSTCVLNCPKGARPKQHTKRL